MAEKREVEAKSATANPGGARYAAARVRSREDLEAWLADKPVSFAGALASRAALRVLPLIEGAKPTILLPVFRASLAARFAAKFPNQARAARVAARAAAAYTSAAISAAYAAPSAAATADVTAVARAARAAARAAAASARAAAYAADHAAHDANAAAADAAAYAADGAAYTADDVDDAASARENLWTETEADVAQLANGIEPEKLASSRLWRTLVPDGLIIARRDLYAQLKAIGDDWDVWIAWYESALEGNPSFGLKPKSARVVEERVASQDDGWWGRGAAAVNADIRRWVDETPGDGSERDAPTIAELVLDRLKSLGEPASISDVVRAFEAEGWKTSRDVVANNLRRLTTAGTVVEVSAGRYVLAPQDRNPLPVDGVPSPFEYAVSSDGRISLAGDALASWHVPDPRGGKDAADRLEAARQVATDLAEELAAQSYQVRSSYLTHLRRYAVRLPQDGGGNIYLADAEARTLRDEIAADLRDGCDERFARQLARVLEQHYGLRVYFPDLLSFYEDVRLGELSDPPPLEAFEALGAVIGEYTPDVFEPEVGESVSDVQATSAEVKSRGQTLSPDHADKATISLPPDPIADVDPIRAGQRAKAGALNSIWAAMLKLEKGGTAIKRAEGAIAAYGRYVKPVLEWLLGGPPPPS